MFKQGVVGMFQPGAAGLSGAQGWGIFAARIAAGIFKLPHHF
jgi:hypothetical protein